MNLRRGFFVVALAVITSCGGSDTTAPPIPPLTIAAEVIYRKGPYTVGINYGCDFDFSITADGGKASDYAMINYVALDYLLASNGSRISSLVGSDLIPSWFGNSRISGGEHRATTRYVTWTGPFGVRATYSFTMNTSESSVTRTIVVPISCGGAPPS